MWIDAHAHLADLNPADLDAAVEDARSAGVVAVVNSGTNLTTSAVAVEQSRGHPGFLVSTVGISPFDVDDPPTDWRARLEGLITGPGVVGLGETGLDATNPRYPSIDKQEIVFRHHLTLAVQTDLPVVIHSRGAEMRCVEMCQAHGVRRAVFHCFTGAGEALDALIGAGYTVSYSGIVTFKGSTVPELVRRTPLDRILIETDSPYLAPHPHRGARNRPALVPIVGRAVAGILGVSEQELASAVCGNFRRVFGVDSCEADR